MVSTNGLRLRLRSASLRYHSRVSVCRLVTVWEQRQNTKTWVVLDAAPSVSGKSGSRGHDLQWRPVHAILDDGQLQNRRNDLHSQLGHFDAAVSFGQSIAILPDRIKELRRSDSDLIENNAIACRNVLDQHMYTSVQAEYQASMSAIQHQVSACQQDFTWC